MRFAHIVLALGFLGGCASTPAITRTVEVPRVPVVVPEPDPMALDVVQWKVMTPDRLKALSAELASDPATPPSLMLDRENFLAEQHNEIEASRYIDQQRSIITMLRAIVGSPAPTTAKPASPE